MKGALVVVVATLVSCALGDEGPFQFNTLPGLAEPTSYDMYTGFITVNETAQAELFYWFFESQSGAESSPLVLWMTGGPGCSSELAIFYENGPFYLEDDGAGGARPIPSDYSWNKNSNIIFIDQPCGTGFSSAKLSGYVHNEKEMAEDMYLFLQKWLLTFPQYQGRPFYIFGESYAGHYVPSVGYAIVKGNSFSENLYIPLQSIAIGNGMTSPTIQYNSYGAYAAAHALITRDQFVQVEQQYQKCYDALEHGEGNNAVQCNSILSMISLWAGPINEYDTTKTCTPGLPLCYNFTLAGVYLNDPDVQAALHVDKKWRICSFLVHSELSKDWWSRQDYLVPDILASGVAVNVYNGILGYICNFLGCEMWMNQMTWPHQEDFTSAPREIWYDENGIIAGYRQSSHNLSMITVNNAGHMVPMDQPKNAFDMFTRILNFESFGEVPGQ
eukprot:CAMPEP_0119130776 /NCGR_PEP_ID=MMETSP1310-20130426/8698_1 /TAXON_ID=464262 /ORGANISM="Genus nov. species nov., Strain RCC2339" /LENGTH=442 /DNA_ID=CAMNT_0007121307 /DNA_START=80 /DNA_END=1408 /DNA_ORIENTATION=+